MFNGVRYPLSYHFAPGASDDGVTLTVPAVMLVTRFPSSAVTVFGRCTSEVFPCPS